MPGNLYIFLFLPTFLFAIWAQLNVKLTFNKYSKAANLRGLTGRAAAETVLHENGIYDVRIEHINGSLSDHYDPKTNTIRLSDSVYDSRSIAAVGVAAHEAGHAVQYSHGYFPIKIRSAIIPITQIGSNLALPLVLLGVFLSWGFLAESALPFSFSQYCFS